jgi:hypothetical protein
MGLMDKARQTAEQARAGVMGERPPAEELDPDATPPPPPSARAGAAVSAFIERINPGLLADLIIHATSAQEKTNKALREKGSHYRISEMYLTASIPPQIGFYISRMGDPEEVVASLPAGEPPAPVTKKAAVAKKRAPRPAGP